MSIRRSVIPAEAGIQRFVSEALGRRVRGDELAIVLLPHSAHGA